MPTSNCRDHFRMLSPVSTQKTATLKKPRSFFKNHLVVASKPLGAKMAPGISIEKNPSRIVFFVLRANSLFLCVNGALVRGHFLGQH